MFGGLLNTSLVSLQFSTSTKSGTEMLLINCNQNCFNSIFQYSKNVYELLLLSIYLKLTNYIYIVRKNYIYAVTKPFVS